MRKKITKFLAGISVAILAVTVLNLPKNISLQQAYPYLVVVRQFMLEIL